MSERQFKTDTFWYAIGCFLVYVLSLPFLYVLLCVCTVATMLGYRSRAEGWFFWFMRKLP